MQDAFRQRVQTLSLHTMDPTVEDAVVHLDNNAGTKNRLWTSARAIAEVLCTRRKARCSDELQAALDALRLGRAGVASAGRNAILQTTLRVS